MLKNNIDWHLAELCIDVSKIVYEEKPEVVKFLKDNKIKHSSVKLQNTNSRNLNFANIMNRNRRLNLNFNIVD